MDGNNFDVNDLCSYGMLRYLADALIKTHISTIYELMIDPHNEQLPVGLIAQLVEHYIGIVHRGQGLIPAQAFLLLLLK